MASKILSYDDEMRIAHFVPHHFDVQEVVDIIRWKVKRGSRIRVGRILAEIFWNDGFIEKMKCPTDCSGTVGATNRRIKYFQLGNQPPQFAYRLD